MHLRSLEIAIGFLCSIWTIELLIIIEPLQAEPLPPRTQSSKTTNSGNHSLRKEKRTQGNTSPPPPELESQPQPQPQEPEKLNILALGGSVTWGATLENKSHAYPGVLARKYSHNVINEAIRATGADYPSHCIESMIGFRNIDFDVILLEFSLNGHDGMELLMQRLRARYPNAIFIYVHLYSFQVDIEDENGVTPFHRRNRDTTVQYHWGEHERNSNLIFRDMRLLMNDYEGYIYDLPRTTHVMNSKYLFGPDWHHLSPEGHDKVAAGIMNIVNEALPSRKKLNVRGTWGDGDQCTNWFTDGLIPLKYSGKAVMGTFEGFGGSYKYALYFNGTGTIFFNNDNPNPVPLYISYMTKAGYYPDTEIRVGDQVTTIFPKTWWERHVMVTKLVGWAEPGSNEMTIIPTPGWQLPFRVTAIDMCGACIEFNEQLQEYIQNQRDIK